MHAIVAVAQYSTALLVSVIWVPLIVLAALIPHKGIARRAGPALARPWGYAMLALCRCRLEISAEASEVLDSRAARVLTMNHSSTLDMFIGGAIMPEAGVTVAKREIIWVPMVGLGLWAVGCIFLDRGNPDKARASLAAAAARIRRDRLQVIIAPEGTRSLDGKLGSFKLGAFHLARQAEIPIVPLVLHGCADIWPRERMTPRKGVVWITRMDEVHPAEAGPDELHAMADRLHDAYAEALAQGPSH